MRVLFVVGTRPEAIKMAPLIIALKENSNFESQLCVTGQHRELLDQALEFFDIEPEFDLNLMKPGQDLFELSSRILVGLKQIYLKSNPDMIFVHGDTTTSTIAAFAAFYLQIPIGHVEAGLRTNNLSSPFPEEANRQLTSRLANLHFAPTLKSKDNLLSEGIDGSKITITGNTVIDALLLTLKKIKSNPNIEKKIYSEFVKSGIPIDYINSTEDLKIVLITGHRRENFGDSFINICKSLKSLSKKFSEVIFIYPMHFNPNVRKPIEKIFGNADERKQKFRNIFFIEPLNYPSFVYLMNKSTIILTDSGGIQEEAPSLGKPVLVMRDTSERPEAINAGTVKLVGTDSETIINEVTKLLQYHKNRHKISKKYNPYGDGKACQRIIETLQEYK